MIVVGCSAPTQTAETTSLSIVDSSHEASLRVLPATDQIAKSLRWATAGGVIRWGARSSYSSNIHPGVLTDVSVEPVNVFFGNMPKVVTIRGGTIGENTISVSHQPRIELDRDVFVLLIHDEELESDHPVIARRVLNNTIRVDEGEISLTDLSSSFHLIGVN
jgi:hypothetical protein